MDLPKDQKFSWQQKYFVESISADGLKNVINYIQTQDEHHQKISFSEEVEKFLSGENISFHKPK